jgi:hypothetical protein
MRRIFWGLALGAAMALALPAAAIAKEKPAAAKAKLADEKSFMTHLNEHNKWPATKAELVAQCNNLSDVNAADKKWFVEKLPEGSYKGPEEVKKALGLM